VNRKYIAAAAAFAAVTCSARAQSPAQQEAPGQPSAPAGPSSSGQAPEEPTAVPPAQPEHEPSETPAGQPNAKTPAPESVTAAPPNESAKGQAAAPSHSGWPDYNLGLHINTAGGSYTPIPLSDTIPCQPSSCAASGDIGARFRLSPVVTTGNLRIYGTLDLILGNYYGDRPEVPVQFRNEDGLVLSNAARLDLRFLYVEYTTPIGLLRVGQMGSNWGLGIVTNDGSGTPTFGEHRSGDIMERAQFITKPFLTATHGNSSFAENTILAFGGDLVLQDPNAWLVNGQTAVQGVAALAYRLSEDRMVGLYYAYRYQTDTDDTFIRASVLDAYGTWHWPLGDLARAYAAAEGAWILGSTSRFLTDAAPGAVGVNAIGGAARAGVETPSRLFAAEIEGGYASGDNSLDPSVTHRFQFNPEYKVGLVLFDCVLARSTATSALNATNPNLVGSPPLGTELIPTYGAVQAAEYLAVTLKYRSSFGLALNLGGLVARSTGDLIDPVQTIENGSGNVTLRGQSAAGHRNLGTEIDIGVDYNVYKVLGRDDLGLSVSVQYGHLFPGSAFAASDGTPMAGVDAFFFRVGFPGEPPMHRE
jgi:hypothetical protein